MIKLQRIKLVNFIGIHIGLKQSEFEADFSNSENNIILLLGNNGSGKTTILSEMTPIPLEHLGPRNKSRIIPDKVGIKELDLLKDRSILYKIKIVYDTVKKTTNCFISKCVGKEEIELNPNGNVGTYLEVLETELGLSKQYTNIGYLSRNIKNFVSMKPTDRNNYVSEWMQDIAEFLDAYRISSKILTKLKRDIDNYNNDIGKMSTINYELELKFIDASIKNLTERIEQINNTIVELNTYQSQIEILHRTDLQLENLIIIFKKNLSICEKEKEELFKKYKKLSDIDVTNDIEKEIQKLELEKDKLSHRLDSIEGELLRCSEEIQSNDALLNKDPLYQNENISSILSNIESLKNVLEDLNTEYNELHKTFGKDNIEDFTESDVVSIKTILPIIESKLNQINDIIPLESIEDLNHIDELISKSKEDVLNLTTLYESKFNELTKINNEIYKYENSNLDENILMKRPEFCKTHSCGIIEELLKYLDPKNSLKELNDSSKKLQEEISHISQEKDENEKRINGYQNIYQIYTEIDDLLHKNTEKIAKMPNLISSVLLKDVIYIYPHMNRLKLLLDDLQQYSSIISKKRETETTIRGLEDLKTIIVSNDAISKTIDKLHDKHDSLKQEKFSLYQSLLNVSDTINTYQNYSQILEQRDIDISVYNEKIKMVQLQKTNLEILCKNSYVFNSNKKRIENLESEKIRLQVELNQLNSKRDEMTTFYISKRQIETMRNELQEEFNRINILNKVWSPKVGYPSWRIEEFLNTLTVKTNQDLEEMWESSMRIEEFDIGQNEFSIVVNKNGDTIEDASLCSQGETSTLNLAISFAMIEMNIERYGYDIIRLDEIDDVLDEVRRASFIGIVKNRLDDICCDTCAIISHNNEFDDVACDVILLKGAHIPEEKMYNKNVVFKY